MRRLAIGTALGLGLLAAYLALWPVPVDPVAWNAPEDAGYTGPFAANDRLAGIAVLPIGGDHGPEDVAIDAKGFLGGWAAQAHRLGWPGWELFGCHRRAPWGRIQGMGLVLLLRGDQIAALTATEAAIRTQTGAHQTYRRKPSDPLHPGERCLGWELS